MKKEKIIMFVYNNFTHDARVQKEAKTLTDAGYSVIVIAVKDNQTEYYEERNGISIYRVATIKLVLTKWAKKFISLFRSSIKHIYFHPKRILSHFRIYVPATNKGNPEDIKRKRIEIYNMQDKDTIKGNIRLLSKAIRVMLLLLFFLDYYLRSFKLAYRHPAGIYHAHDLNTLPIAFLIAKYHRAKVVYDSHEFYTERNTLYSSKLIKFLLSKLESFLIRKVDTVITVNQSLADEFVRKYRIKNPYIIMNTPSYTKESHNFQKKSLRKILGISKDMQILIYCGSITFNRGLEKLIESLKYLPQCHLVLMGYGLDEYKRNLKNLATTNKLDAKISFFGPVPTEEVTSYAASADLGVAPIENVCLSYYYCSPNKLFEYINARIPVVASEFPELKKVIRLYNIGETFDPRDPLDIARAVSEVLKNENKLKKMKENTMVASKIYNWETESKKLLDIYRLLQI